jgi:hypothetical protein
MITMDKCICLCLTFCDIRYRRNKDKIHMQNKTKLHPFKFEKLSDIEKKKHN